MPQSNKSEMESRDRVIDIEIKKTESKWAYAAQSFFESFTQLWFKWIGWIFATGGVAYIADQTGSTTLRVIEHISILLLWMYFLYFFASIRIQPYYSWARSRSSKLKRAFALFPALLLALALTLGVRYIIHQVIEQIQIAK